MTAADRVARQIRSLRPHAKFVAVSHSSEFIDPAAELGDGFFSANLYDEKIDANLSDTKFGPVMIENTYIASFAFNIFLCWLGGQRHVPNFPSQDLLLAHNFKKFFAEQIYRQWNCVASRALMLETLVFEQVSMVEVFAAKERDQRLSRDSDTATRIMTLALSLHELGHFYMRNKPDAWAEIVASEPSTVGMVYERVRGSRSPGLTLEFQCDVFAVLGCLRQFKDYGDPRFAFRTLAFSFAAYAAMYSATKTAEDTAALWKQKPEEIDLLDISAKPHVDHDVQWAIDTEFVQRAKWVLELCAGLAGEQGLELFGQGEPFSLPDTILSDLLGYVGRVFDSADPNARRMSNLLAEALHSCPEGMEYLYLRSKTFRTNRTEPLKVEA